ncbi:MAG: class I adenylate cyclase [Desulfovibrio sp.]|uniref:class I adenylate cyclase n=1 Tax=Desulfovibrio sp. 7SRBS1 TaxID=3378064 RepID=UPI003B3DBAB3
MVEQAPQRETLLRSLRSYAVSPPTERLWPEMERLVRLLIATGREPGEDFGECCRAFNELAIILYGLAERADPENDRELVLICLRGLAELGPLGRTLFIDYVEQERIPFDEPAIIIAALEDQHKLHLLNSYLMSHRRRNSEFHQFALDVLTMIKDSTPMEVRHFLAETRNLMPGYAFPVTEAIHEGAYGIQLGQILDRGEFSGELLKALEFPMTLRRDPFPGMLVDLLVLEEDNVDHLLPVFRALKQARPRAQRRVVSSLSRFLNHPDRNVAMNAFEVLAMMGVPVLGRLAAALYTKRPAMKKGVLVRLPMLGFAHYQAFLRAIPRNQAPVAAFVLFLALCRVDPENISKLLDELNGADALKSFVSPSVRSKLVEPEFKQCNLAPAAQKKERKGLFGFGGHGSEDKDSSSGSMHFALNKETSYRLSANGREVVGATATECDFTGADFAGAFLKECVFERCTFRNSGFSVAVFTDCRFVDCTFKICNLRSSRWFRCVLDGCRMEDSLLSGAGFSCLWADASAFVRSCLFGAQVLDSELTACAIQQVDLSSSEFDRVSFSGMHFGDCMFRDARLSHLRLDNARFEACVFVGCSVAGLSGNDPVMGEIADHTLAQRLAVAAEELEKERLPRGLTRTTLALSAKVVATWFRRRAAACQARPFLVNNFRRLNWAQEKMERRQVELLQIIPFLLHSDFFDRAFGLYPQAPPCHISGYVPDYTTLELTRKYLPDARLPETHDDAISIEGLYTIGSLGTVAQSASSDVDYWVCCDLDNIAEDDVQGLNTKLEAISQWADSEFDLEVYFFLMDVRSVRENNFGSSGGESSGTAQALMLKEEFYRTAVHVAGKLPVWWIVPPGTGQAEYDMVVRKLDDELQKQYVDLGHVAAIPISEFFGASLWQIVKAMKSPFKSIMKFGLLERYISQGDFRNSLLCDRIKANLLAGHEDIWHIDPYVLLFSEVAEFYANKGERDTLELVKMSFFLKSQIKREAGRILLPARLEEKNVRQLFSGQSGATPLDFQEVLTADEWNLGRLIEIGTRINQFVINTYLKVREQQKAHASIAINPLDLTKLGRKIFSTFAHREHKIDRLSFTSMKKSFIDQIEFTAETRPNKGQIFVVQGGQMEQATRRMESVELKRNKDIAWLFTWLAANGVYIDGVQVKVDFTLSPVIVKDCEDLLSSLVDYFPPKSTFDTDIGENLNPERVVKAYFILNLMQPREAEHIQQASIVYSTNWGEMFCKTVLVDDDSLNVDPLDFLRTHVEQECSANPKMDFFIPHRSTCPGILVP